MTPSTATASPSFSTKPWWRFGYVWLILAGPLVVVVASFITLGLAIRTPDPVVAEDYYRRGIEINQTLATDKERMLVPALQARNHAATPSALPQGSNPMKTP